MTTLRESMMKDSVKAMNVGRSNIGMNGVRKGASHHGAPVAYFQSKDFDKACGNPLIMAFVERKMVRGKL